MDWQDRKTHALLGKTVTVRVDRPVGYDHHGILYPINYGYVPGLMGGDGEEQDAYILGVTTPVESFTGKVVGVIRRLNDCEDKLVVASGAERYHQGQIAAAVRFQEQYFVSTIDCLFRKSCGVIPFREYDGHREFLIVYERHSKAWSFPKGHMEAGETEVQAALRELFEETGLQADLICHARASTEYSVGNNTRKEVVYFLGKVRGDLALQSKEITKHKWVSASELGLYLFPDTASAAANLIECI